MRALVAMFFILLPSVYAFGIERADHLRLFYVVKRSHGDWIAECKISVEEIVTRDGGVEKREGNFWVCKHSQTGAREMNLQDVYENSVAGTISACYTTDNVNRLELTLRTWTDYLSTIRERRDPVQLGRVRDHSGYWELDLLPIAGLRSSVLPIRKGCLSKREMQALLQASIHERAGK